MEKGHILIVEDEEKIARVLQLELEYEGYNVTIKYNGTEGLNAAAEGRYSLVLLDVMLPGLSGLEVLRRLRKTDQQTPVILLTARDSIPDKVTGLDIGANDYVTKPFEIEELLARIRVALRQNGTKTEDIDTFLTYDDLRVNEKTREVRRGDKEVELTPREFDLLVYMLKHPQQVLTREQILNSVWGFDYIGDTNVVDVYIRYIRKKLDYPYEKQLIHTVRGVGYAIKG
ncbi:two-component system response regulator YkoG [Bacillus spizizenii]|uniref:Two-component system response regulator YkoG n=2 Tax=Bacillus spizizenii TaxID=96241 RepID=A0A9Q4HF20_BACSC|nr:two-component system response regulator YkoG [Bacillus spizizenii]KFI04471.1 PhoB family transcriptional regulator [Bacillus sp. BSC154]MDU7576310.1 two-component system response regulator YkoG [Bacillus subtilis]ADM37407.1 two-component response regulator (paired with YkoH) [Bacillus spizizenii str. W23]AJW86781.1 PhoB family transcriptional regulator [Bacillus spizizenii]EFG94009.1 two-component response regulator (YkoH) [Bacillus spizizenii ATCC 6633 = JCM 2499]